MADKNHKIHLHDEKETLLITLYAKALDNRLKHPILHDQKAEEILGMIDYDFEKLKDFGNEIMVARAKQFDVWLQKFLKTNPNATVLNLGCGLDTRISRIHPPSTVRWFDIDYPEVIEIRKKFFSNQPGYEMVPSSVTDPGWLENIPDNNPVMIIAEGMLEYLTETEVKTLLNRLTDHFSNGQIAFDVMNTFAVHAGKKNLHETTGAEHKWAVDHIGDSDKLNPDMKRMANVSVMGTKYIRKLPLKSRLLFRFMYFIPNFRNMMRLLLYKF